jgi:hypothetical protein
MKKSQEEEDFRLAQALQESEREHARQNRPTVNILNKNYKLFFNFSSKWQQLQIIVIERLIKKIVLFNNFKINKFYVLLFARNCIVIF